VCVQPSVYWYAPEVASANGMIVNDNTSDQDPMFILDQKIANMYQNTTWKAVLSNYRQVIPGSKLPANVTLQLSNNCVGIAMFQVLSQPWQKPEKLENFFGYRLTLLLLLLRHIQNRLFIGFRTAPFHFASETTEMYILSSTDMGQSWDYETSIKLGYDVREPYFINFNNTLIFSFFEAGKRATSFTGLLLALTSSALL